MAQVSPRSFKPMNQNNEEVIVDALDKPDEPRSIVTVGYLVEPEYSHSLHRRFFPSKVGGKPAWLDPEYLPNGDSTLHCSRCHLPMTFLLQVYAGRNQPKDAFHRSIYIFVCCNCTNVFIALRSQLPLINSYYPSIPLNASKETYSIDECLLERCCNACGIPTSHRDWPSTAIHSNVLITKILPTIHKRCQNAVDWGCAVHVFHEAEIEIDDECRDRENTLLTCQEKLSHEQELLMRYYTVEKDRPDDLLDETEQQAFEDIQRKRVLRDRDFSIFLKYMDAHPNHIIRYAPGSTPLWLSSFELPSSCTLAEATGPCLYCGAPRQFEFQVQPNLINELNTDRVSFGVLCIYTCSKSCSPNGLGHSKYLREFVVVQPEPFRIKPV